MFLHTAEYSITEDRYVLSFGKLDHHLYSISIAGTFSGDKEPLE